MQQRALGLAAAHPRSRGENGEPSRCTSTRPGSSPLTRGKQTNAALAGPPGRLIPAHAGKTCSSRAAAALIAAHPRSRGENGRLAMRAFTGAGSSPLTRGKHEVSSFDLEMPGLIPAHAGKTSRPSILGPKVAAHPRSRGENPPAVAWRVWLDGSSPLTRGKLAATGRRYGDGGLIPAHAGKTSRGSRGPGLATAHPRSRGENVFEVSDGHANRGSSPLTRGKHPRRPRCRPRDRLIPAHAGKTTGECRSSMLPRAHPRSRGENRLRCFW